METEKEYQDTLHLAHEMYPLLMKIIKVWIFIAKTFYEVVLYVGISVFLLLVIGAVCKILWWILFIWKF